MGKITKKLKRSIVMLLVCALVAGSIPMNTYAATPKNGDAKTHTVTVVASDADVELVSGNGMVLDKNDTTDEGDVYTVSSGDSIDVTVTAKEGKVLQSVTYTVSDNEAVYEEYNSDGEQEVEELDFDIPNISADVTIYVTTSEKKGTEPSEPEVTVWHNIETVVSGPGAVSFWFSDNVKERQVSDNDTFHFRVTPSYGFDVETVTYKVGETEYNDPVSEDKEGGYYYTVASVDGDVVISVVTREVDEPIVPPVNPEVTYESRKIDVSIYEYSEYVDVRWLDGHEFKGDEVYTSTSDNDLTFKVTLTKDAPDYLEIGYVYADVIKNGDEWHAVGVYDNGEFYSIRKADLEDAESELFIYISVYDTREEVRFNIENATVTIGGVEYTNRKVYKAPYGEEVEFVVKALEGCTLEGVWENGNKLEAKDGKDTYAVVVGYDTNITVKATKDSDKTVNLVYDTDEVEVESVIINGLNIKDRFIISGNNAKGKTIYEAKVADGATVKATFKANPNYKIVDGTKELDTKTYTINKVNAENGTIEVDSKAVQVIKLTETFEVKDKTVVNDLEATKGVYTIDNYAQRTYTMEVFHGSSKVGAKVEILDGRNVAKTTTVSENDVYTFKFDETEVKDGKNLTLKVTGKDDAVTTATLKVLPVAKTIVVNGGKNDVEQAAYTVKEYAWKVTPANAINDFDITHSEDIVDAWINSKGKLSIQTGNVMEGVKSFVSIKYLGKEVAKLDVEITDPLEGVKPTVKYVDATNATMTLKLGVTGLNKLQLTDEGWEAAQYVVTLTPDKDSYANVSANLLEKDIVIDTISKPVPFEKGLYLQDATISLGFGEGKVPVGVKYNVEVKAEFTGAKIYKTDDVAKLTASAKAPAYETKLKVKTLNSKIYAGQKLAVAQPVFSKTTTYKDLGFSSVPNGFTPEYENGVIYLSVDDNVAPGKYEFYVVTDVDTEITGMLSTSAKVTVTVLAGIDWIYASASPFVYKKENAKATFKVNVKAYSYSADDYLSKPKVKYTILDSYGESNKELDKYITVKDGTVTIAKDYVLNGDDTFYVQVEAVDYVRPEGFEVVTTTETIKITNEEVKVGALVVVDAQGKVLASGEEDSISVNDIIDGEIKLLFADAKAGQSEYQHGEFVSGDAFKVTANNKNFVFNEYGIWGIIKPEVKNVKLTAALNDGTNRKVSLTLKKITGTDEDLNLDISSEATGFKYEQDGDPVVDSKGVKTINYKGTYSGVQRAGFKLEVNGTKNSIWYTGTNFKVSYTNANKVSSTTGNGITPYYTLEAKNNKPVTITLENKTLKVKKVYTLTNTSLDGLEALKGNVKVNGSFIQNRSDKTVTVTLPNGYAGKVVKLSKDLVKSQKDTKYRYFANYFDQEYYVVEPDNTITVGNSYTRNAGSYKLYLTVGEKVDGQFVPTTLEKAVTFKVVAPKKHKLVTSYTINLKDGDSVPFAVKPQAEYLGVDYTLKNINVKGQPNNFAGLFEVIRDEGVYKLRYKGEETDLSKINKNDLTGWVYFWTESSGGAVQIKVNLKNASASKYTIENATVIKGVDAKVAVTKNKVENFEIAMAYTPTVSNNETKAKYVVGHEGNYITVPANQLKVGKNVIEVYVIGTDTLDNFRDLFKDVKEETKEQLFKTYGVKLKTTITVVDSLAATDSKVDISKSIKLTSSNYDAENDLYRVNVSFKEKYTGIRVEDVANVSVSTNETRIDKDITVSKDGKTVEFTVSRNALSDKAGSVEYGKTVKVDVKFTFNEGFGAQTATVSLKLPSKPKTVVAVKSALTKAIKAVDYDTEYTVYKSNLEKAVNKVVAKDVVVTVSANCTEAPTYYEEGQVTVYVTNNYVKDDVFEVPVEFGLLVGDTFAYTSDLEDDLVAVIAKLAAKTFEHNTIEANIKTEISKELGLAEYPNLIVKVFDATNKTDAGFDCKVKLYDTTGSYGDPIVKTLYVKLNAKPAADAQ